MLVERWNWCWSRNCLKTIQCWSLNKYYYTIILTTIIIEPHLSIQMWLTPTVQLQRMLNFKKSWNKWQLKMAESLYLIDTTLNLTFAIKHLVLFDSVVGGKKKFLYSNISTECQYKMCDYIHSIHTHAHISRKQHLTTSPFLTYDSMTHLSL